MTLHPQVLPPLLCEAAPREDARSDVDPYKFPITTPYRN
jgi:hypothetical protein